MYVFYIVLYHKMLHCLNVWHIMIKYIVSCHIVSYCIKSYYMVLYSIKRYLEKYLTISLTYITLVYITVYVLIMLSNMHTKLSMSVTCTSTNLLLSLIWLPHGLLLMSCPARPVPLAPRTELRRLFSFTLPSCLNPKVLRKLP